MLLKNTRLNNEHIIKISLEQQRETAETVSQRKKAS